MTYDETPQVMEEEQLRALFALGHGKSALALEREWAKILAFSAEADYPDKFEELPRVKYLRQKAKEFIEDPASFERHNFQELTL